MPRLTRRAAAALRPDAIGAAAWPAEVFVWDRCVRVLHWSMVALVGIAFTAGPSWLHAAAGLAVLPLVGLRVVWGFVGPAHARFSDFVAHPTVVLGHLRALCAGRARHFLGHGPAGGAMAVTLLVLLPVVAVSGCLSAEAGRHGAAWLVHLHTASAHLLLLLAGLHVAGVLASRLLQRESLVRAMLIFRNRVTLPGE